MRTFRAMPSRSADSRCPRAPCSVKHFKSLPIPNPYVAKAHDTDLALRKLLQNRLGHLARPSQHVLKKARITNPDGFVFVRAGTTTNSPVIGEIKQGEAFYVCEDPHSDWWLIRRAPSVRAGYGLSETALIARVKAPARPARGFRRWCRGAGKPTASLRV